MTPCTAVQFLEPNPVTTVFASADDHSLPIEEGGTLNLVVGVQGYSVNFAQEKLSADYDFLEADVQNTVDGSPLSLDWEITAKTTTGFTVTFNALPDTTNYTFNWLVRVNQLSL